MVETEDQCNRNQQLILESKLLNILEYLTALLESKPGSLCIIRSQLIITDS